MFSLYSWVIYAILFLIASFCCAFYSLFIRHKFKLHDRLLTKVFGDPLHNPYRFLETEDDQIARLSQAFKFTTFIGIGCYFIGLFLFFKNLNDFSNQINLGLIAITICFMLIGIISLILAQLTDQQKMIRQIKAYHQQKYKLKFCDFFDSAKPSASIRRNQANIVGLLFLLAMLFCIFMFFNSANSSPLSTSRITPTYLLLGKH